MNIENQSSPYKDLWCAVIYTALDDVANYHRDDLTMLGRHNSNSAVGWLGSNDFYEVCRLVGIHPKRTLDMFYKVMNESREYDRIKTILCRGERK